MPKGPFATRFWDCCKPAFSWPKAAAKVYAPVDVCQKDGITLVPKDQLTTGKSGCEGGDQFTCSCIQPWVDSVDPSLGYGFAAYNIEGNGQIESACYLAEFQPQDAAGKQMKVRKLILQNINTSKGITHGSFDFNLAGGGVGAYDKGCKAQWGTDWGKTNGGVDNQQACCQLPEGLRSSCLFRFVMFGENPALASTPKRVRCPQGIIDRSGSQRQDDVEAPVYSGKTDRTGQPAPDKYQRNRSVCQNIDPLGIVSSVCGGNAGGSRLPKGYGMLRQDSAGGAIPADRGSSSLPGLTQPESHGSPLDQASLTGLAGTSPLGQQPPSSAGQPGLDGNVPKADPDPVSGNKQGVLPKQPEEKGASTTPNPAESPTKPATGEQQPIKGDPSLGYGAAAPPGQGLNNAAAAPKDLPAASGPVSPGIASDYSPVNLPRSLGGHSHGVCRHKRSHSAGF